MCMKILSKGNIINLNGRKRKSNWHLYRKFWFSNIANGYHQSISTIKNCIESSKKSIIRKLKFEIKRGRLDRFVYEKAFRFLKEENFKFLI